MSLRNAVILALCALTGACGGGENASPSSPSPPPTLPTPTVFLISEAERQYCLDRTNQYRATVGRGPLRRSATLDTYADTAARYDIERPNTPHAYFNGPGKGTARAENQIWSSAALDYRGHIDRGLAGMWAEGPGGPHHENIRGPYSEMGCGAVADRTTVIVQAFR